MPANVAPPKKTGATVLSRALEIRGGEMLPEGARFVFGLGVREEDRERSSSRSSSGGRSHPESRRTSSR